MAQFLIADLHLDDKDAIENHNRPFESVTQMNETLVRNWNRVVSYDDTVIFLGDLTGPTVPHEKAEEWVQLLHGDIVFILGNNDSISGRTVDFKVYNEYTFENDGYEFYCTHKPSSIPEDWLGWGIHGHVHQRYPQDYPYINYRKKQLNVSAEMLGYTPVPVDSLTATLNTLIR